MPLVEASVKRSSQYALRIVDIKNWNTPVVQQHKIRSIPQFVLFDPAGQEVDRGDNVFRKVVDPSVRPERTSSGFRRIVAVGLFVAGLLMWKGTGTS